MKPEHIILVVVISLFALVGGLILGYFIRVKQHEGSLQKAKDEAEQIVKIAKAEAAQAKKESIYETKNEIQNLKREADKDIRERKNVVVELEHKLTQREESLDRRSLNLDKREETLNVKETKLDDKKIELEQLNNKIEEILVEQQTKLAEIAALTKEEARNIIMTQVKDSMSQEIAQYIKDEEDRAKDEVQTRAKNILALAIQKYASETSSE